MKTIALFTTAILLTVSTFAQKDWSKVDFSKEYKGNFKIGGASAKSLKKNKTFISNYTVSQATTMKGSEKTAGNAVFSEVSIGGLNNEMYQQLVDELYKNLVSELEKAGLQITQGDDVLASSYAQSQAKKDKKDDFIGSTGENPVTEGKKKITEGSIPGYAAWAVTRDISFQPRNKNVYSTSNLIRSGNFYQKLSTKEDYNLLSVSFHVSFASFDGGRGYKDIKLETKPVLAISATIMLVTPNGAFNKLYYKDGVWGSADWSEGIVKGKDNKNTAEFLGLARSADYEITANPDKYLSEVKAIINGLQKDIAKNIQAEL